MTDTELIGQSESYIDTVFWPGAGAAHTAFLDTIAHDGLREAVHRCHLMQADDATLSIEDNYLIGMCVLYATGHPHPADMFAKTLAHLGVERARLLEAVARLSMWIGPIPAAGAAARLQRALTDYTEHGRASLSAWIPAGPAAVEPDR